MHPPHLAIFKVIKSKLYHLEFKKISKRLLDTYHFLRFFISRIYCIFFSSMYYSINMVKYTTPDTKKSIVYPPKNQLILFLYLIHIDIYYSSYPHSNVYNINEYSITSLKIIKQSNKTVVALIYLFIIVYSSSVV